VSEFCNFVHIFLELFLDGLAHVFDLAAEALALLGFLFLFIFGFLFTFLKRKRKFRSI
jgi:hypothetical protein